MCVCADDYKYKQQPQFLCWRSNSVSSKNIRLVIFVQTKIKDSKKISKSSWMITGNATLAIFIIDENGCHHPKKEKKLKHKKITRKFCELTWRWLMSSDWFSNICANCRPHLTTMESKEKRPIIPSTMSFLFPLWRYNLERTISAVSYAVYNSLSFSLSLVYNWKKEEKFSRFPEPKV